MKALICAFLSIAAVASVAWAQETPNNPLAAGSESPGPNRFWQANLPGGHYMVQLDRISSISRHRYLLDGAALVDEVTIDCLGQALARFYFISPITTEAGSIVTQRVIDRAKEVTDRAANRVGTDAHEMVVKQYPATTHARTIEFRILSKEQLDGLYKSLQTAWESGRGRQFSGN